MIERSLRLNMSDATVIRRRLVCPGSRPSDTELHYILRLPCLRQRLQGQVPCNIRRPIHSRAMKPKLMMSGRDTYRSRKNLRHNSNCRPHKSTHPTHTLRNHSQRNKRSHCRVRFQYHSLHMTKSLRHRQQRSPGIFSVTSLGLQTKI